MKTGELATRVGVNPKTIRFYEDKGLLPAPARRPSGYRDYGEEDAARLSFIRTAQRLGFNLAEIAEILAFKERGERPCDYVLSVLDAQVADVDRRLGALVALRAELVALPSRPRPTACQPRAGATARSSSTPRRPSRRHVVRPEACGHERPDARTRLGCSRTSRPLRLLSAVPPPCPRGARGRRSRRRARRCSRRACPRPSRGRRTSRPRGEPVVARGGTRSAREVRSAPSRDLRAVNTGLRPSSPITPKGDKG